MFENSPVEQYNFQGLPFFLKRDDLLSKEFSGNKARKLYYYLENNFPNIDTVISYGSAQSNSMYSISVLAKLKGWKFDYYVDHIADYLKSNPHGNYEKSLGNGMNIHEGSIDKNSIDSNMLFIEEGGANDYAAYGVELLAKEIIDWKSQNSLDEVNVFLPSGTGTTALFLSRYFKLNKIDVEVYTTPCVGDVKYLQKQFSLLADDISLYPTILESSKKFHFGKLYKENYKIWIELQQQTGVEYDLLYDPIGWQVLVENKELFSTQLLYIHQGGLIGNESMLPRYKRKFDEK